MPRPDKIPSPRLSTKRRFFRIFRLLLVLSIVIAAIAVLFVMQGESEFDINMIVATALGAGFTVLLGTSLMTLAFLSADSGHDDAAATRHHESEDDNHE